MSELELYDLCVVGGGAAGIAVAIGAALLGVPVALIEPGRPGADGLEALARAAALTGHVDHAALRRHVAATVAAAEPAVAPERLRALGVTLIEGPARFLGPDRIAVAATPFAPTLTARRFVLAPVAKPALPLIAGFDHAPILLPAELMALDGLPDHLAIVGGGAEALEWALAYRRLGCAVTLFDAGALLAGEDPELVEAIRLPLEAAGVRLRDRTVVQRIAGIAGSVTLTVGPAAETLRASHVLIAAGRQPELTGLGLDAAGVAVGPGGIATDWGLRTGNKRIYAIEAAPQAGTVLRQILFRQRARFDPAALPRLVRTDPPMAQVGLTEHQAREAGETVTILRTPLHDLDAARVRGHAHGLVKVVTRRNGRILGAGIVGPGAEDLIQTWQLAIARGLKIGAVADLPMPYPSLGEASRRAAGAFFAPRLLGQRTRKLVRWLALLG